MTDRHGMDPLEYLYEELPPERMAEARRHLGECPECRAAMREIRETVQLYRREPRPAAPEGLAARAARAAVAAGNAAGLVRRKRPAPAPESLEVRRERLEKDFEKLKDEVRVEMREGWWRRWFFHPAWTVAAMALLAGSLAIHFSPRGREGPEVRASVPAGSAAREIRNRERIPAATAAQQSAVEAEAETPAAGDMPPALAEAKARRDLALPALAPEVSAAAPEPPRQAEPLFLESTPLLAPDELAALVDAPVEEDAAVVLDMAAMEPPRLIARPEGFDQAERIRTLATLAGMQIAADEIADAWKTVDMLRRYDPAAADEIAALLAEREKVLLAEAEKKAAAPADAPAAPEKTEETEPVRVRLVERPRPSGQPDQPEQRGQAGHAAQTGQTAQTEQAAQTPPPAPPVRTGQTEAGEPTASFLDPVETEPALPRAPAPAVPASGAEPEPVSVFSLPRYSAPAPAAGPSGEPPLSAAEVPFASAPPSADLRRSLPPSRSAALAQTLTSYSGGATPIYSEPIADIPPQAGAVAEEHAAPFRVSIQRAPRERSRFTTDPYLRDD